MTHITFNTDEVPFELRALVVLAFCRYESYGYFSADEGRTSDTIRVVFTDDLRKWWKWAPANYSAMSFSTQWGHDENLIVIRERDSYDTAKLVHLVMHEIAHILLDHPGHIVRPTSILWPVTTKRQTLDGGDRQMFFARFGRGMK